MMIGDLSKKNRSDRRLLARTIRAERGTNYRLEFLRKSERETQKRSRR